MSSYNPSEYWNERGKVYKKNFKYDESKRLQEEILTEYLNSIIGSFKSVLELGCGFGRITKLLLTKYNNISEYLAVDLSPDQIENAKKYVLSSVKTNNQLKLDFMVSDIQSLNLDKKYDLVILSEVLLHILPTEIDSIIKKLLTLSDKHIINIDWYEDTPPTKQAPHNFIHQYEIIYKKYIENPRTVKRIPIKRKKFLGTVDTKQSIFHVAI